MKKDDMDNRIRLPEGYRISHGGRSYTISRYVSAGGNSIVYQAWYQDSLMPEKTHQVLIKELYPYDPAGRITRRGKAGSQIIWIPLRRTELSIRSSQPEKDRSWRRC